MILLSFFCLILCSAIINQSTGHWSSHLELRNCLLGHGRSAPTIVMCLVLLWYNVVVRARTAVVVVSGYSTINQHYNGVGEVVDSEAPLRALLQQSEHIRHCNVTIIDIKIFVFI